MLKLKQLRLTKQLTQGQLADKAGLNVRTIQHYEQGSKNLDHARIDTILRICIALDCKLIDLIENEEYCKLIEKVNFK